MKRIYPLQTVAKKHCLLSYKDELNTLYTNARSGKRLDCKKCDDEGYLLQSNTIVLGGRRVKMPTICDCVSDEKGKIFKQIESINMLIEQYNKIFNSLDSNMTLDIFANKYNQKDVIDSIKKYLDLGSSLSLYFSGESGVGKTTILKILWQIYAMNNISIFYFNASHFEDLHKNLFNKNAPTDSKTTINKKIENVKRADIIMIDDIDSIGFSYATDGYYKIFDDIRASEKTVIITSNKSYTQLTNSLKNSSKKDNADYINGRLTSRLLNLKIVEVELKRNTIRVETDKKII